MEDCGEEYGVMGEEFPHVRKRVADKVLRDNKNNKMGGYLITKNIYQIYLNFSQEHSTI